MVRAFRLLSACLLVLIAAPLPAQIVVGDPNDRTPTKMGRVSCQAALRDGRVIYSGVIWADTAHPYEGGFKEAFEQFASGNYGRVSDVSCTRHDWTSIQLYGNVERDKPTGHILTGWTGSFPTQGPQQAELPKPQAMPSPAKPFADARPPTAPNPKPLPDYEIKYQQELAAYNQRLSEIEAIKKANAEKIARDAAQLERDKAAAAALIEKHRQEVAQADAARAQYQRELAAHQALVDQQKGADRNQPVDWREAVVVCTFDPANPQTQFGNWRCDGPLQFTYAALGKEGLTAPTGGALTALGQACGTSNGAVHDMGLVKGYRIFGCGFGLHPKESFHLDAAAKYGVDYVPGRAIYRCPAWKTYCRTK